LRLDIRQCGENAKRNNVKTERDQLIHELDIVRVGPVGVFNPRV